MRSHVRQPPTIDAALPTGSAPGAWRRFLHAGALAWGTREREVLEILVLPLLIVFGGAAIALFGKPAYKLVTQEDGIAEWCQVFFYALALGSCAVITWRLRRSGRLFVLYAIVCVGLFFLLGEELSWGQRLVGWETPESLIASNKQGETNIHNLNTLGTGFKWMQLLIGTYGGLLPLWFHDSAALDRSRRLEPWIIPHVTLVPYFGLLFVWRCYRNLFEPAHRFYYVVSEYNEILELVLAIGFFLFMRFQLRALRRDRAAGRAAVPVRLRPGHEPFQPPAKPPVVRS